MASDCDSVSKKWKGNGTKTRFNIPFTYMSSSDVVAFLYNEDTKQWVDQDGRFNLVEPTVVKFFVAPPAPKDSDLFNVWIARKTDLEQMLKEFYAGSSIRAQDLNDNFDQLRLAIQEGRCSIEDVLNTTLRIEEAYTQADQEAGAWVAADDKKIATSDAIAARHDSYVQESVPPTVVYQQTGKLWQNTGESWTSYWQNSVDDKGNDSKTWVAYVNTGPRGEQGPQGPPGKSIVGPEGPEGPQGPSGGSFPDAPADGELYARKDNDWEVVDIPDPVTLSFVAPLQEANDTVTLDLSSLTDA